jgi:hypothetical protein
MGREEMQARSRAGALLSILIYVGKGLAAGVSKKYKYHKKNINFANDIDGKTVHDGRPLSLPSSDFSGLINFGMTTQPEAYIQFAVVFLFKRELLERERRRRV